MSGCAHSRHGVLNLDHHDSRWIFIVIYGFRLVFMVIHGSRSVFHDFSFLMVFMVPGWFISRREVRRREHPKRCPLDLYLGPRIPLGLAVHRPILAYS